MYKKLFFLVLLCAGFSITSQAQTGLFIDYTQSGWFLQVGGGPPNTTYNYVMTQSAGSGSITFSLSENGTYSNPQPISVITDGSGSGQTLFFVKGIGLGPATWRVCEPGPINCSATLAFSVVTIDSLVYEAIDSPLDTNPKTGGGNRIYPEKTTPTDNINRKRLHVKATLSAAVSNLNIYFKSFDLDDPSANSAPVDPDTNGPNTGDDNRSATNKSGILSQVNQSGTTNTVTVATNSSGVADADFTVTMNPGDNFMVAASGDPDIVSGIQIDGITLKDASNNTLPITKAKNTAMLTVWRKIHLEVDNMGTLGTNHESGSISAAVQANGQTTMDVTPSIEVGRYVPGRITINNKPYTIVSNTATQVVVDELIMPNKVVGKSFTIYDDDDYDGDDAWKGDENETSIGSLNAFAKMQTSDSSSSNVYAPAYIMPVYDGGGNTTNNGAATGNVNVENNNVQTRLNAHKQAAGNDDFWVGYIQIGYQGAKLEDFDPASETTSPLAVTPALTGNSANADCTGVPQGGPGSLVYQETLRDILASVSAANDNLTAPHELGHQFGLLGDGSAGGPYGIMDGGYNVSNFAAAHLHILRCRVKSPGL
jgi:hypothetical protein